jgi:hypothetical protein
VLNVSAGGALIETTHRLLPGRWLDLQLVFATGVVTIRGSVLRCAVSHASTDRITYRGGLSFERQLLFINDAHGVAGG